MVKFIPPRRRVRPPTFKPVNHVAERPFNPPLYTLKAFAIATAIVASTATATVVGVMAYLDVHDTAGFAACMRTWVSRSMPRLTARIYRRPTAVEGDPILAARSSTPSTVDHDAAQERLTEAFDKGGLDAWTEAAAREMEVEVEVQRFRRNTS